MRMAALNYYALGGFAIALLAGCGGSQPPIGAQGDIPQASALASRTTSSKYKVLYSFGGAPDGGCPFANLINVRGKLYGTTSGGGAYYSGGCGYGGGGGTVFSVTTGGTESVLHSFGSNGDGFLPFAGLIDGGGTLYGTTQWAVASGGGGGTVFSITTNGTENVLHTFPAARPDGKNPVAPLIALKGKLYGTTSVGGKQVANGGTFFSVTTGGKFKVLHDFRGRNFGGREGGDVVTALIDVGGVFYGTAYLGGQYHKGVVFSITRSGKETVLHSFGNGTDGDSPRASLVDLNGTLYGTTEFGGTHVCGEFGGGCGTVYSISTSGVEKVLYSFAGRPDGSFPNAGLTDVNGTLYGTTSSGGAYCPGSGGGCGTVFSVTTGGTEQVLHSFAGKPDGVAPWANLISVNGTLYGTTEAGGSGYGTVFALTP